MIALWANRQVGPFVDFPMHPCGGLGWVDYAVWRLKKWTET
jgi:hypothetical protein